MPHIHTQPGEHDNTISIYLFRIDFAEPKLLLHLHRKIGKYAQFGGHIELHETPWQALKHELEEESGYTIEQTEILQPDIILFTSTTQVVHPIPSVIATMKYPGNAHHAHIDSAYTLVAKDEPKAMPHDGESQDLRFFTKEEIEISPDIDPVTRDTALYIYNECLLKWRVVSTSHFS